MPRFHIGIVKFYDSDVKQFGRIKSKNHHNGQIFDGRFSIDDLVDKNFKPAQDSVIFFTRDNGVIRVYEHTNEIPIPWDEILSYADDRFIIYNDKSSTPVDILNYFLRNISNIELQNLLFTLKTEKINEEDIKSILAKPIGNAGDDLFSKILSQSFTSGISRPCKENILYLFDIVCKREIASLNEFYAFIEKIKSTFNNIASEWKNIVLCHIVKAVSLEIGAFNEDELELSPIASPIFIDFFLSNCLAQEYCQSLSEESGEQFKSVLTYILNYSCKCNDYTCISKIVESCSSIPQEWYDCIIKSLNLLFIEEPASILSCISKLCGNENTNHLSSFEIITQNNHGNLQFYKEISIAYAIIKKDISLIHDSIYSDLDGGKLKEFLSSESISNDDFIALGPYLRQSDTLFNKVYIDCALNILSSGDNIFFKSPKSNADSIFGILLDLPEAQDIILSILSNGDETVLLAAKYYQRFSDIVKRYYISLFNNKKHNAKLLLNPSEGISIADVLSMDQYYIDRPTLRIRSEMLVDGYVADYLELKNKGIIDEISNACIKSAINKVDNPQGQYFILNQFGLKEDEILDFLVEEMPDSKLIRTKAENIVKYEIESFINNLKTDAIVFDIEGKKEIINGKSKIFAWDYAYKKLGQSDSEPIPYRSNRKRKPYLDDNDWEAFGKILIDANLLIGHNINRWDLILLREKSDAFNNAKSLQVWDSLEVEVVLHPERASYALNAYKGHIASNDVKTNEILFRNQLLKIIASKAILESVEHVIPCKIFNSISILQNKLFKYLPYINVAQIENGQEYDSCFYGCPKFENICSQINKESTKRILIVANQSLWPQIAKECKTVDFEYPAGTLFPWCSRLKCKSIEQDLNHTTDVFKRNLLLRAKKSLAERAVLHCSDIPYYILSNIEKDFIKQYIYGKQNSYLTCIEPIYLEQFISTGKFECVYVIGDRLQTERQDISNDLCVKLRDYIIASEEYSPYNSTYYISNDAIKELGIQSSQLFKYQVYQDLKGGLALYRHLDTESVKQYCIERQIEVISNKSSNAINPEDVTIIRPSIKYTFQKEQDQEDDFLRAWYYRLNLFENFSSNYPKVLIVETRCEAQSIADYFHKLRPNEPTYRSLLNGSVRNRLDKTDEEKLAFCLLSLDELKPDNQALVDARFTIFLCNLFRLEKENDSVEFLFELQKRLNQYCSSFELAIIQLNNLYKWNYFLEEQIDLEDSYDANKITLKKSFLRYVDVEEEFNVNLVPLLDDEGKKVSIHGDDGGEKIVMEHSGKMLQWIERNLLDNKYTGNKLKAIQIKALRQPYAYPGNNNVFLTVMPTGYGKSLIFQGPALYSKIVLGDNKINIVISPLQALMRDQVYGILGVKDLIESIKAICERITNNIIDDSSSIDDNNISALKKLISDCNSTIDEYYKSPNLLYVRRLIGQSKKIINKNTTLSPALIERVQYQIKKFNLFENNVAYINATTTLEELNLIELNIKRRRLALLYIAPERLMNGTFFKKYIIGAINNSYFQGIGSFIFDEAHCITGWGMDFRPSYIFALRKIKEQRVQHPDIPIHLFTATLPKQAKIELSEELQIDEENIIPNKPSNDNVQAVDISRHQLAKEEKDAYLKSICPIQEHISTNVIRINDGKSKSETLNNKIERISRLLTEYPTVEDRDFSFKPSLLCPEKSRMIIFTYSRMDAIEGSELLAEQLKGRGLVSLSERIAFFHAGMELKEKDAIIDDFSNGNILILFSTKAFGLGMDIPNIHYVVHLTPPAYIEDYLQEIGRAGRNITKYKEVFPAVNGKHPQIKAICLYSNDDIKRNKDRISTIKWGDITSSYKQILSYISDGQFGSNSNVYAVVPKNLLEYNVRPRQATNNENADLKDIFMQSLIWLSKGKHIYKGKMVDGLDCIEIGADCPNSYDINILNLKTEDVADRNLIKLLEALRNNVGNEPCRHILESNSIIGKYGTKTISDIEFLIDEGVKCGKFSKDFMYISIKLRHRDKLSGIVNNYPQLTALDLKKDNYPKVLLSAIEDIRSTKGELFEKFAIIKQLIKGCDIENNLSDKDFEKKIKSTLEELGYQRNRSNIITKDAFLIFKELSLLYPIDEVVNKCCCILITSFLKKTEALSWKTITDVTGTVNDKKYAKLILVALNKLKFIVLGNVATDYIEIRIKDSDKVNVSNFPQAKLAMTELKAFNHAKENKSGAMCGLIEFMNNPSEARKTLMEIKGQHIVKNMDDSEVFKEYIKIYSTLSLNEIGDSILLKNYEYLQSAARQLDNKIKGNKARKPELDELQQKIYYGPKTEDEDEYYLNNFNVLAGAGSGKTRLLSYWALKLILTEYVEDKSILVLAYNRAVRDTILHRMISYASEVGYTLKNPQVFTFHEFALSMLKDKIIDLPFEKWEEALLCDIINNPSKYHDENQFGFILVDEFQDITSVRLEILKRLISDGVNDSNYAYAFFVGDSKQSIYGYEKRNAANSLLRNKDLVDALENKNIDPAKHIKNMLVFKPEEVQFDIDALISNIVNRTGGYNQTNANIKKLLPYISIDPKDYYQKFAPISFKDTEGLTNNYRSTKQIIDLASSWLNVNISMTSQNAGKMDNSIMQFDNPFNLRQFESMIPDIRKLYDENVKVSRDFIKDPFEIGILFRCNAELYEAYDTWIRSWVMNAGEEYSIRIQGSDIYYSSTREFYHYAKLLAQYKEQITTKCVSCISFRDFSDIEESERCNLSTEILDVAKQLTNHILIEKPDIDNKGLLTEFWHIANSEREHLKLTLEMAQRQRAEGRHKSKERQDIPVEELSEQKNNVKFNIILSVIHRSKGLEYDVVITPTSQLPILLNDSDLDFYRNDENAKSLLLEDLFDEERRLMYVAYSRAKDLLFYQIGSREEAIRQHQKEDPGYEGDNNKIYAPDGLGNVDMGYASIVQGVHENIQLCKINEPIILKGHAGDWLLYKKEPNGHLIEIGKLSQDNPLIDYRELQPNTEYYGLKIKSINVLTGAVTRDSKIEQIRRVLEENRINDDLIASIIDSYSELGNRDVRYTLERDTGCTQDEIRTVLELIKEIRKQRAWRDSSAIARGYVYYVDYYGYIEKNKN